MSAAWCWCVRTGMSPGEATKARRSLGRSWTACAVLLRWVPKLGSHARCWRGVGGAAIASALAKGGARVACVDIDLDTARRSPDAIGQANGEASAYAGLCCADQQARRTMPLPCPGSCDPDILRASKVEHAVQRADGDRHLARATPVRA